VAEESNQAGPKPLVIQAHKDIVALGGMTAVIILLTSFTMVRERPITALFGFALAAMMLLGILGFFQQGSLYLELTSDGLSYGTRKSKILSASWRDIKEFRLGWRSYEILQTKGNRTLFIDYQRNGRPTTRQIYPGLFGMNPDDMLKLMMQYYRAAAAPEETSVPPPVEK
jgi:hypothetical protein